MRVEGDTPLMGSVSIYFSPFWSEILDFEHLGLKKGIAFALKS